MAALHIRNVPDDVVDALRRRAERHERSLQGELRVILREVARDEPSAAPVPPISLKLSHANPPTTWDRESIYGDDGR